MDDFRWFLFRFVPRSIAKEERCALQTEEISVRHMAYTESTIFAKKHPYLVDRESADAIGGIVR